MMALRKYIKVFILLVLPVYLILLVNSISNMHVHLLSNGVVIQHAHPFDREGESKLPHQHSHAEYQFYQAFFHNYFDNSAPLPDLEVIRPSYKIVSVPVVQLYCFKSANDQRLRGPPLS
ncbi:hypothetical protein [Sunxiuqinia indica]|uniref:hypothetical protein n=1 Tax=Sunxiuqinia indica TaxID=2692584 RepID=UPI00135C24F8|nr:hypothetical protein [Sunxiuqinia indica]